MVREAKTFFSRYGLNVALIVSLSFSGLALASSWGGQGQKLDRALADIQLCQVKNEEQDRDLSEYKAQLARIIAILERIEEKLKDK